MGYQVGNVCYQDMKQAENAYFSLVAPVVMSQVTQPATSVPRPYPYTGNMTVPAKTETVMIAPQYIGGKWTLQGKPLQLYLPPCDPAANFKQGAEIGWLVFALIAAMYVFVLIKRLLR